LTPRERQILGLLADGKSGAKIAAELVLSPETVRTHVRNAMSKLGASTRSQAVAMAVRDQGIDDEGAAGEPARSGSSRRVSTPPKEALERLLSNLVSLYDVEGGAVFLADADGLALTRVAATMPEGHEFEVPVEVALGEGPLGRAALDRRAQLMQSPHGGSGGMIVAPMVGGGRLLGVIALLARSSRPVARNEMLLLQAFAVRVGDMLVSGDNLERRIDGVAERFRATWLAAAGAR
jgi:DNA-binding CsgD family transcriptional regulator